MKYNVAKIVGKEKQIVEFEPLVKSAKLKYEDLFVIDLHTINPFEEYSRIKSDNMRNEMFESIVPRGVVKVLTNNPSGFSYIHFVKHDEHYKLHFFTCVQKTKILFDGYIELNRNNLYNWFDIIEPISNGKPNAINIIIDRLFNSDYIKLYYRNLLGEDSNTYFNYSTNSKMILDIKYTIALTSWFLLNNILANEALLNRSVTYIETGSDNGGERKPNSNNTNKEEKRTVVNLGDDIKVYINDKKSFSKYIKTTTRNITCSFNVCGHWRYYRNQDGSVRRKVWIEGYMKGQGKPFKGKTYILPQEEKEA